MVLHPLIQRECCFCSHVPFSPFERVQTSFSAAGRHSSSTFPFLILESAYKAVGPGFSGPGDSWITAWTRLQVGMVNILPAWHYPPPLLPPTPSPVPGCPGCHRVDGVQLPRPGPLDPVLGSCVVHGRVELACLPCSTGCRHGKWKRRWWASPRVPLHLPPLHIPCVYLLFKRRGRDIKGWRRPYVTHPFLNK